MNVAKFQILEMRESSPQEWLSWWAQRFDEDNGADPEYACLIEKHKSLSADDFRLIGKWKDNAWTEGKYKLNVASVAFAIWEQAATELPKCPADGDVATFLEDWSNREYTDEFKSGPRKKHFGLSRATTLLHFVSGGLYPIFDSRVKTAIARLQNQPELPGTVPAYLEKLLPVVMELAGLCQASDLRTLDKALFAYGASDERIYLASNPRAHATGL